MYKHLQSQNQQQQQQKKRPHTHSICFQSSIMCMCRQNNVRVQMTLKLPSGKTDLPVHAKKEAANKIGQNQNHYELVRSTATFLSVHNAKFNF